MALVHANSTVGTTVAPIITLQAGLNRSVAVQIFNAGANTIFIGDKNITATAPTQGRPIAAGGSFQLWLNPTDIIFAIAAIANAAGTTIITYSGV